MIKGTLLVCLPIVKRFSVDNFLSPKMRTFCSLFRTPWKTPWTDINKAYGHVLRSQALRSAIFGAKVLSALSKITRLIKKRRKTCAEQNSLPYRHTPERAAVIKYLALDLDLECLLCFSNECENTIFSLHFCGDVICK